MEMQNEEIHLRVNAIHRMKTVILSMSSADNVVSHLVPYLGDLIKREDDEVLFAIAEEIGNVF
jgi:serine/threonine-protein phosphatase 2A regulatory subunit A